MKNSQFIFFPLISALALTACSSNSSSQLDNEAHRDLISISQSQKRINTIECKDFDDWYLDGNRVGRSYSNYKNQLLDYRVSYCKNKLSSSELANFKQNWELGYQSGNKMSVSHSKIQGRKVAKKRHV
ncbi:MAG: hypothetical protein Q4A81_01610 [Pasteurellaceae bacterium]|nr:hypothetical protein [Pasteurellaceae bacterium]